MPFLDELVGGEMLEAIVNADDGEAAVDGFNGGSADDCVDAGCGSASDDDSELGTIQGHDQNPDR